jgi:glycosidase
VTKALKARPAIHPDCQWATFVRNHDELTLDKLTDAERQEVFAAFGPEPAMQIYGRGLKRRLPTMMDGDPRRIRMVYSLLFSLPGTPTLYYGEEIGMGEDLEAEGRMAVRTPMQWEPTRNGGFSTAAPRRLVQRPVPDGYAPEHVNVADQKRDPDSLWAFMRSLIQTYRECPELGWGDFRVLEQPHREVLAHRCAWRGSSVLAVHNLSSRPMTTQVRMDPDDLVGDEPVRLEDLFADETLDPGARGEVELALEGYGHRWFRVRRGDE